VDSIAEANLGACADFVNALNNSPESAIKLLQETAGQAELQQDWHHKARLAIVALHLGDVSLAQDMCQLRADPIQRTVFIHTFPRWHEDLKELKQQVAAAVQPAWRSGICLAIGSARDVSQEAKANWEPLLREWYFQPDALTHSAAGWALKQWELELPRIASTQQPAEGFDWYLNSAGLTMIRIRAGQFERQVASQESGKKQTVRITRDFLLTGGEITLEQFRRFINDPKYQGDRPVDWPGEQQFPESSSAHPLQQVSWYDAVMFCNWLSWKQGLAPCYKLTARSAAGNATEQAYEVEIIEGASGFRLPTEAEWEYACRAGTTTLFSCGDDAATLDRYCVTAANSNEQTKEVGSRMCNAWGLHDMHGNVWEWCWDWFAEYGEGDVEDPQGPSRASYRVYRGGSWLSTPLHCRSAFRFNGAPSDRSFNLGFRVARVP
jgi:formylglycine-generating enzyme required for sulfatase activity